VRVEQSRAEAEVRDVSIIAQAVSHDWRAAAWRLERRNPKRYGKAAVAEALPGEVGYGRAVVEAAEDDEHARLAHLLHPPAP